MLQSMGSQSWTRLSDQTELSSMKEHSFLNIPKCLFVLLLLILFRFSGQTCFIPHSFKLLVFKWLVQRELLLSTMKNNVTKHKS